MARQRNLYTEYKGQKGNEKSSISVVWGGIRLSFLDEVQKVKDW